MSCPVCSIALSPEKLRRHAKFCSPHCYKEAQRQRYQSLNPSRFGLRPNTAGTISELRVVIDLLQKGYQIFRAVDTGAKCDLAIVKNALLKLVEVKSAHYRPDGKVMFGKPVNNEFDYLALCLPDQIIYQPPLTP